MVHSVVIIGSGPAGLTAAIYASRANLKPFLIEGEEAGGQLMTTTDVENYPGFPKGVLGPDLMSLFREQAERFGTHIVTKNVTKVDFSSRPFQLWVGEEKHLAHSVIISTGASAKYLGLESEKKLLGFGVSACATCDGAFFKDQKVCIVGGGDTAMEEALFLTRFATHTYLLNRSNQFRASRIMLERVRKHSKIEILENTQIKEILGDKEVSGVLTYHTETKKENKLDVTGVFIAIGHTPNTELFKGILEMDNKNYLVTKPNSTATKIPGVFACGDVQDPYYRQAVTAAGTGCMSAIEAERYLAEEYN